MNEKSGRLVNPLWVKVVCDNGTLLPKYQTVSSAGCDLHAAEEVVIKPGKRALVATGLKIELPCGITACVCPRSGLAIKHGITVLNAPGIIDSDYRGEIKVILFNAGEEDFFIKKGDRIAQLIFTSIIQAIFQRSDELSETDRGEGGFGSTGISSSRYLDEGTLK